MVPGVADSALSLPSDLVWASLWACDLIVSSLKLVHPSTKALFPSFPAVLYFKHRLHCILPRLSLTISHFFGFPFFFVRSLSSLGLILSISFLLCLLNLLGWWKPGQKLMHACSPVIHGLWNLETYCRSKVQSNDTMLLLVIAQLAMLHCLI